MPLTSRGLIVWASVAAVLFTVGAFTAVFLPGVPNRGPAKVGEGALRIRGADISFALQEEAIGQRYSANSTVAPIEEILAASGANYVRLRVWVNPPPGYSDVAAALRLAARAKKAGLKLFLTLHYSDFWADSKRQEIPAAWQAHDLPTLAATVRDYTRDVLRDFARQGTPVDMVQIGNEVTHGMLWPVGQVYRDSGEDWSGFTNLLKAGIDGARAGNEPNHHLSIVIHTDRGADNDGARYFLDHILAAGITSFDAIGLSYYPFWQGPLSKLQSNLDDLATRYQKDLIVAETAYPWTLEGGHPAIGISEASELPDGAQFPPTVSGQEQYFRELRRVLEHVPDQRGVGLFLFEPGWLPGVGWEPGAENPWVNLTAFDWNGRMLPALAVALAPPATDAAK